MSGARVVIFDFDGTLVSRDSFLDFCLAYSRRRPWRFALVLLVAPLALVVLARSQRAAGSVLLWAMTVGTPTRRFVVAMRRYARESLARFAFEDTFRALSRHLSAGDRVILATGSVTTIPRGLLAARGFPPLPVLGSRLRRCAGGLVVAVHCVRSMKAQELARRYGLERWHHVYTNSFSDAALMARAAEITLIWPSEGTVRGTQQLLGSARAFRIERPT